MGYHVVQGPARIPPAQHMILSFELPSMYLPDVGQCPPPTPPLRGSPNCCHYDRISQSSFSTSPQNRKRNLRPSEVSSQLSTQVHKNVCTQSCNLISDWKANIQLTPTPPTSSQSSNFPPPLHLVSLGYCQIFFQAHWRYWFLFIYVICFIYFFWFWGSYPAAFRDHSWWGCGSIWSAGIKLGPAVGQTSVLPSALSLAPEYVFAFGLAFEPHTTMLRSYTWLWVQGSFLAGSG